MMRSGSGSEGRSAFRLRKRSSALDAGATARASGPASAEVRKSTRMRRCTTWKRTTSTSARSITPPISSRSTP